jgi:hypothetical protein
MVVLAIGAAAVAFDALSKNLTITAETSGCTGAGPVPIGFWS